MPSLLCILLIFRFLPLRLPLLFSYGKFPLAFFAFVESEDI